MKIVETKIICDFCKSEIRDNEYVKVEITSAGICQDILFNDKKDVCFDCFNKIKELVE